MHQLIPSRRNFPRISSPLALVVVLFAAALSATCGISPVIAQPPAATAPTAEPVYLTRDTLTEGIDLARQHMLAVQTRRGDFEYEFNLITDEATPYNHPARQAGGLWGLAMLYHQQPSEELREAVLAGLRFFYNISLPCDHGACIIYPDTRRGDTGAQALVCLAEIEFLRTEDEGPAAQEVRGFLEDHLAFLASLRRDDGHFFGQYNYVTGRGTGDTSPYYDGEAMLALSHAAAYMGYEEFVPAIMQTAEICWDSYVINPVENEAGNPRVQFFQWGCMSYYTIYTAGWPGSEPYAERVIEMTRWQLAWLEENIGPEWNRAASYEGICLALALARQSGDVESEQLLEQDIAQAMLKLAGFQVGHSLQNDFLSANPPAAERALGGCLWSARDPLVRIDAVFHQLHALLLARAILFEDPGLAQIEVEQPAPVAEPAEPELTLELLDESLDLARQHMLGVQTAEGDFVYEFDYITGEIVVGNNQVRQAGGLWGMALLHHAEPTPETREATLRGIRFWQRHSRAAEAGGKFVAYPGETEGKTGTQALVALAEIEFLRTEPAGETYDEVAGYLAEHLDFLVTLQLADGRFHGEYNLETGAGEDIWSPYSDGEALLALAKAAAYLGYSDLVPKILLGGEGMWQSYVVLPAASGDERKRTQFYQWGSMSFYEIYKAGWEGSEPYAERVIEMAYWRIDGLAQRPSPPSANYAYAYEGLCSAWEAARLSGDTEAQQAIGQQIDRGVLELMGFQVGNPLANEFIQANPPGDPRSLGGCLLRAENPNLRIDCVQHQAHALLLTRRFLFDGP